MLPLCNVERLHDVMLQFVPARALFFDNFKLQVRTRGGAQRRELQAALSLYMQVVWKLQACSVFSAQLCGAVILP